MRLLISPTEPGPYKDLGRVSSLPETYGVDVLFSGYDEENGRCLCGVQRKRVPGDLLASIRDGRLAKELAQMSRMGKALILLEGRILWTNDGRIVEAPNVTISGWFGIIWSLQFEHGVGVLHVETQEQAVAAIRAFAKWCQKKNHQSLVRRPKAPGAWGRPTHREWAQYFLQGLPGIGPQTAEEIYRHFGGIPMRWSCRKKDLEMVPGVGKKRADEMWKALEEKSRENVSTRREEVAGAR